MRLKEYLRGKFSKDELESVPSSFDIVGDIAIFNEMPKKLIKKEKIIGNALLSLHKNIKVICKKTGKYSGKYRTPKLKIIAGEKRKETTYIENGCRFLLDVEKVYFSSRLGNERARIVDLVRPNENVLVMFSGIGPYTVQIAKKARKVTAIEANPVAHKYALKNLILNKIRNSTVIKGDVKKVVPKLKEKFDRILMPLPKSSEDYLGYASLASKKGAIIHLYTFAKEEDYGAVKDRIISECKRLHKVCRIIRIVKAGEYAPKVQRICVDFSLQ